MLHTMLKQTTSTSISILPHSAPQHHSLLWHLGYLGGQYKDQDYGVLGCDAVYIGRKTATLRRKNGDGDSNLFLKPDKY